MKRDERIYAFIIAHTPRRRFPVRKFAIHRRWLKLSLLLALAVCGAALYGLYSFSQEVAAARLEQENSALREENEKQRRQLDRLKDRVEAVEDQTRRLAEISGADEPQGQETPPADRTEGRGGAGGPRVEMDAATVAAVEEKAAQLEQALQLFERALRERARIPSIWPTEGRTTDNYGSRSNPFGGGSFEFHGGLDIATAWGTPVVAAGSGTVAFAGWQGGYGQVVILDHGDGLSTRYGHLSRIEVSVGQQLERGQRLGRVGSTGRSTGPHLHYEVRLGDTAVNPRRYLPARVDGEKAEKND